jgi:hypothetical protein
MKVRMMDRVNYTDFEGGFHMVILEESFVLNLKTTMSFVDFQLELAINQNYPLYTPPEAIQQPALQSDEELEGEVPEGFDMSKEGEEESPQYSFRRGRIFFPNMEQVKWQSRIQPYIDPRTGSVDYGSIDYFYRQDNRYFLAGYWGEIEIVSGPPMLEIDELKNQPRPQVENTPKPQAETEATSS